MPNEREVADRKTAEAIARAIDRRSDTTLDNDEWWYYIEEKIYKALAAVRAELTASGSDVETAEKLISDVFYGGKGYPDRPGAGITDLRDRVAAALTTARNAERSKVPPPDEIHRDGYNVGKVAAEARVKALEAAAGDVINYLRCSYCDGSGLLGDYSMSLGTRPTCECCGGDEDTPGCGYDLTAEGVEKLNALAALLAGEGKGEEAEREGGAGRDALEEVE